MLLLCCSGTFVSEPLSLKQSAWDYLLFFEFGDPNSFGHFNCKTNAQYTNVEFEDWNTTGK